MGVSDVPEFKGFEVENPTTIVPRVEGFELENPKTLIPKIEGFEVESLPEEQVRLEGVQVEDVYSQQPKLSGIQVEDQAPRMPKYFGVQLEDLAFKLPKFYGFQLEDLAGKMPNYRAFQLADQNPHVYQIAKDGSREFTSISSAIAALKIAQGGSPLTCDKFLRICDNEDYTDEGAIDFYNNIGGAANDKRIYLEPLPGYRPKISSVLGSHWVTVQDLDIEGPATLVYARYLNGFNLFSCRLIRTGASGGYGYYRAYEGSLCKVYNNFFIGDFYTAMNTDVINDELCFNSIYLTGTGSGRGIGGYRGIIKNNIVYCDSASKVCFTNMQSKWPNLDMNYNCFYHPSGNIGSYYDGANWIGITNLSAWQTLSGKDLNSVEVDPVYIDPGNNDLHLHITSPLKGFRGTPITGVTADHDGDVRDEYFPAMGADEIIRAGGILTMKSKYW